MEIKPCAHCGGKAFTQEVRDDELADFPFRVTCGCGISTLNTSDKDSAIDIWNSRVEPNPSEADRWFEIAIAAQARADLAEMQRDELSEALEQAKRMLAYSGKLQ